MKLQNINNLLRPLIKAGHEWQYININGKIIKPKLFFTNTQFIVIALCIGVQAIKGTGISESVIGYIISAFAISTSLFMSLLVNIFDKFEKTKFDTDNCSDEEIFNLIRKKNFFKRFISITSYLVLLSVFIVVLCSISLIIDLKTFDITPQGIYLSIGQISGFDFFINLLIFLYRSTLYYFILNYLVLTIYIASSAFEYYISELNRKKVENPMLKDLEF